MRQPAQVVNIGNRNTQICGGGAFFGKVNAKRYGLDAEKVSVKRGVMCGAQHEAIAGVIGTFVLFASNVGCLKNFLYCHIAHGTSRTISLKNLKLELRIAAVGLATTGLAHAYRSQ